MFKHKKQAQCREHTGWDVLVSTMGHCHRRYKIICTYYIGALVCSILLISPSTVKTFITQCFPFFLLPFHVCSINPGYVCICGYKKKTLDTGDETKMQLYKISLWFATSTGIYKNIFLWVWQLSWKRNLLLPSLHNSTVHRFSFISWSKGRKRIPFIKHQIKMKEEMWDFTLDHYFLKNV